MSDRTRQAAVMNRLSMRTSRSPGACPAILGGARCVVLYDQVDYLVQHVGRANARPVNHSFNWCGFCAETRAKHPLAACNLYGSREQLGL